MKIKYYHIVGHYDICQNIIYRIELALSFKINDINLALTKIPSEHAVFKRITDYSEAW